MYMIGVMAPARQDPGHAARRSQPGQQTASQITPRLCINFTQIVDKVSSQRNVEEPKRGIFIHRLYLIGRNIASATVRSGRGTSLTGG